MFPRLLIFFDNTSFIIRFVLIVIHFKYRITIFKRQSRTLWSDYASRCDVQKERHSGWIKLTRCAFDMPNLPHEITIMIVKSGQKYTVSYSDKMCDSNSPDSEKNLWRLKNPTQIKYDVLKITVFVLICN